MARGSSVVLARLGRSPPPWSFLLGFVMVVKLVECSFWDARDLAWDLADERRSSARRSQYIVLGSATQEQVITYVLIGGFGSSHVGILSRLRVRAVAVSVGRISLRTVGEVGLLGSISRSLALGARR